MKKKENTVTPETPGTDTAVKTKRGRKPRTKKPEEAEPNTDTVSEPSKDVNAAGDSKDNKSDAGLESALSEPAITNTEDAAEPILNPTETADTSNKEATVTEPVKASMETDAAESAPEPTSEATPVQDAVPTEINPEMKTDMENSEPDNTDTADSGVAAVPDAKPVSQVIESPLKLMKQEFQARSQKIREQMRNIQDSFLIIGFQLFWIRENNMFRVLNYKNIYSFAEAEYGIKKTTCCNFINIIENYAERDENGNVIESIADCYKNYSSSQLVAMLGMPLEMQQQVTPDMSVRAINRLRKSEPEMPVIETTPSLVESKPKTDSPIPAPAHKETIRAEPKTAEEPTTTDDEPDTAQTSGTADTSETTTALNDGTDSETIAEKIAEKDTEATNTPEDGKTADISETDTAEAVETLMELDNSNYQSELGKLDAMLKSIFSAHTSVRIKIVCEQG